MYNIKVSWLGAPQSIPSLSPPADTPITWDADGNVLSRFGDRTWSIPGTRRGSTRSYELTATGEIQNGQDANRNVRDAKQLAALRMTNGSSLGLAGARFLLEATRDILRFCSSKNMLINRLHRHELAQTELFSTLGYNGRLAFIALARLSIAFEQNLGWRLLEPHQIDALDCDIVVNRKQTPVVPLRLRREFDRVAMRLIEDYLDVADDFTKATLTWCAHPVHRCTKGKSGYWPTIIEEFPSLKRQLNLCVPNPIARNPRDQYIHHIREAAFWIIAGGSSARREEILTLERGCFHTEPYGGTVYCRLVGPTTKTQENPNAIWLVAPRVERAIRALQSTIDWYYTVHRDPPVHSNYLFQVMDMSLGKKIPANDKRVGKKLLGEPIQKISFDRLSKHVCATISEADLAEARALTPSLSRKRFVVGGQWRPTPHQTRRTVLVHAVASGLVSLDSAAYQAKHGYSTMTEYYTKYFWLLRLSSPDDPLVEGTDYSLAEMFSKEYVKNYNHARDEILSSNRFFSFYGDEHKKLTLGSVPLLSFAEIKSGEAAGVLKRNTLGICAQADPCEHQSAHTVRGCMTKSDGQPCVHSIVDDTRTPELKALINDLRRHRDELRPRDTFARNQVEADIRAAHLAIERIERHRKKHAKN